MNDDELPKVEGRAPDGFGSPSAREGKASPDQRLQLCFNCSYHFRMSAADCPFCGANVAETALERMQAFADVFKALGNMAKIVAGVDPDEDGR